MFMLLLGLCLGIFIFEPIIINFIYFKDIDEFLDLILTKNNKLKLEMYYVHLFIKQRAMEEFHNENKKI